MSEHRNSSHEDYDIFVAENLSMVRCVHLLRGIISMLAFIPNVFVLFLYFRAAKRRPSARNRINYAIVNLLITDIVYCGVLCVYSFLKRFAGQALMLTAPCLTITWFAVFASFEPLWAMFLVAFARMIFYARIDRLDRFISTQRFLCIRFVIMVCDVAAAGVIIAGEADEAVESHCNYQLMLDSSKKYLAYSLLVIIFLGGMGLATFVLKILWRNSILRRVHSAEKIPSSSSDSESNQSIECQLSDKPNDKCQWGDKPHKCQWGDKSNDRRQLSDKQSETVPGMIWQKPKLIFIAIVVVFLFIVPRVAFFCGSRPFWLISTLCPAMMTFFLPLAFLWTTKDFRFEFKLLFSRSSIQKTKPAGMENAI